MTFVNEDRSGIHTSENAVPLRRGIGGFSLLEMSVVLAIILIISCIGFITLQPSLKDQRLTTAYNATLMTLRRARQLSVDQRKTYMVTFNHGGAPAVPDNITLNVLNAGAVGPLISTTTLPPDVQFLQVAVGSTPDNFGTGAYPIDFNVNNGTGGSNVIYFKPDGGAYDNIGRVNNGVVYVTRPAEMGTSRAITLYGLTGRLRGWKLQKNLSAGTWQWTQI